MKDDLVVGDKPGAAVNEPQGQVGFSAAGIADQQHALAPDQDAGGMQGLRRHPWHN
jgi:hypothetical protein